MISQLRGILLKKNPTEVLIDVNGVGYTVHIPLSTYTALPDLKGAVTLLTHFHVREDTQSLFGFMTELERELFRLLISVSGIGPRSAQTILSGIQPKELQHCIAQGNTTLLTTIPGVGRKTAERVIVELRDKMGKILGAGNFEPITSATNIHADAVLALMSLGFTREKAEFALRAVLKDLHGTEVKLEELVKRALQSAGR